MSLFFHVDINSYFATLLQQENPSLRGKPVGVLKGVGRSCIIAASKEAKALGVSTAANVAEARKKIPNLILIPAHFGMVLSATRKLRQIFSNFSPRVEIFSLDEVFLDLTGCETLMGNDIYAYARHIQTAIQEGLGEWVTCNVGISHNKLLAKMAGEIAPKGEILRITQENMDEILATVELKDVCGVGWGLQKKLHALGVYHPLQINFIDDCTMQAVFGPHWSKELRKIAQGEETHFFARSPSVDYQQSVGRTITGYRLTSDEQEIKKILLNLLEEATYKLRAMDLSGRKVGISLWGHEHAYWGKYRTLRYWVRHTNDIWNLLYKEMYCSWKRDFPIIKFGVWIGDCKPTSLTEQNLLPEWGKNEKLYSAIDQVNRKFGSFAVMPATLLGGDIIRPEVTGFLGDRKFLKLS